MPELSDLALPPVSHLGIVVDDLSTARRSYAALYGVATWYQGIFKSQQIRHRDMLINLDLDIAFGYSGRLQIELVEVRSGDDNIYSQHLKQHGEGLHHVGFTVKDLDRQQQHLHDRGIPVVQSGRLTSPGGAVTRYAYFDTTALLGYQLELVETRLFGIPLSQSRLSMTLGCLTGDTRKLPPVLN